MLQVNWEGGGSVRKRREEHQCVCIFLPLCRHFNERQHSSVSPWYSMFTDSFLEPLDVDHCPVLVDNTQSAIEETVPVKLPD